MKNKVINLVTKGENDDYTLIMEALENYDELLHSENELLKAIKVRELHMKLKTERERRIA